LPSYLNPELPMPPTIADPPRCYSLFFATERAESQQLDPDPSTPRARDSRGRFADGRSGNALGRPRGIPNPKRRVPDLVARPLAPDALTALLDRKPYLLPALAAQILPPPLRSFDPAGACGIDLSGLRTAEDCRDTLGATLAAVGRGYLAPAEAAWIARYVRSRLRSDRQLKRLQRRLA
jgi:hypothetical protein